MTFAKINMSFEMILDKNFYLGLLFECPLKNENDDRCYKSIRLLEIKKRIEFS